ncbi:ATP-binding protein [Pedobacter sp. L105]|uniref:PAS domain-containing sensor histidine kinase n=1 Tax=Pedobacter sp. L105 TaxID=1641871 RepID=UPI00131C8F83|nr:ATP-binding protein [Pedobacter sp. L105]
MNIIETLKAKIDLLIDENKELNEICKTATINDAASKAYEESQVRFQTVFECSSLGNKIISSDLKIMEVNAAMLKVLGYKTKDEIIGTRIFDYVPEEYQKDWRILQQNLWNKKTPSFSLETCLMKKDGTVIWCRVTSILFTDQGETLGYTIIEDISEQHKLRQQKEEFISVASHELKTPITSLYASLQVMNKLLSKAPGIDERIISIGKKTELHTIKLTNLVHDLLNTTKIEQGQLALNKSIFKLSDVIDGCCSHVELEGKYYLTFKGDHHLEVFADEQKINQVLINLINNAMKYAPDVKEIIVQVQKMEKCVKVMVIDQGPGIPEDSLSKLFERYFRVKSEESTTSGLGLGLYISAEIIKRHGGSMGVKSEIGKGSQFWFTLPDAAGSEYY